jgi:hypothetical protein
MSKGLATVETAASLRALLAAKRPRSWNLGYPEGVRARVRAYASRRLASGSTVNKISEELGLSRTSVRSWMAAPAAAAGGMRRVEVVPEATPAPIATDVGSGLVLVSPRGYRVEGLDVWAAARLLLAVG